ncbi:M20/M25/M40 family metallo-hydrolase [Thalassobacillus sp. CUG 92003]|uniref:M20/M25/M40 family metallo-hydrolase n=1 Tax=Thalassobacillus sp. CUG 92003 TaxID=2736641 RepID=UPI0015E7CFDD|nr:M20/M25/M40 family metallo-hydrolase [Thalassobacillus sp. CUG 92003]
MARWQSKQQLVDLLCSIVEHPSITGSDEEIAVVEYLQYLLGTTSYFQSNPHHLQLHPLKDGRQFISALVKQSDAAETVILISHVDVVGVGDYASYENIAFRPRELTKELHKNINGLPQGAAEDLASGDWLFGRGTMDMKAGLTVHLSLLEKAMDGTFDGNILLLAVPDEEVNSEGMLAALPVLEHIKEKESLSYKTVLNGEPMFSRYPGDSSYYLYTGSIGKVLPGFLCYGKETHAGEPFAGLNANLMVSHLAQELELNEIFIEESDSEKTPPPVSLMQRDLKEEYSVQTPQAAVAMYNVLYMKQSISELNDKLLQAAKRAGRRSIEHYFDKAEHFLNKNQTSTFKPNVNVLTYDELYQNAVQRYGKAEVERRLNLLIHKREEGDRDFSTRLIYNLASLCKDLTPMIVLFYSPPFYPAVSSDHDPFIQAAVNKATSYAKQTYGLDLTKVEYFTGLSDLSFIGPSSSRSSVNDLVKQMPIQGKGYQLPVEVMDTLNVPIINVGPLGKDPHQWTERVELTYSFAQLPDILTDLLHFFFKTDPKG